MADLAGQEAPAEARSFDDVERAGDGGGIAGERRRLCVGEGRAEIGEVGDQRRATAALRPVRKERLRAGGVERRLRRDQSLGMGLEEARIGRRIGKVEAREQTVEPLMRLGRALAERAVGCFQAESPNTRAKIASTCLK